MDIDPGLAESVARHLHAEQSVCNTTIEELFRVARKNYRVALCLKMWKDGRVRSFDAALAACIVMLAEENDRLMKIASTAAALAPPEPFTVTKPDAAFTRLKEEDKAFLSGLTPGQRMQVEGDRADFAEWEAKHAGESIPLPPPE